MINDYKGLTTDTNGILDRHFEPAALLFSLWKVISQRPRSELTAEEVVLLDAWVFDSTFGNGMVNQLRNEQFDEIANGLKAIRALNQLHLTQFVDTMESIFQEFHLACETGDSLANFLGLQPEVRKALEEKLGHAEKPFLPRIWTEGAILGAAKEFLIKNIQTLHKGPVSYD